MFRMTVISLLLFSNAALAEADLAAGKKHYEQICGACHGVSGEGNDGLGSPALAGQQATYMVRQLEYFSKALRGAEDSYAQQMAPMAATLKESSVKRDVAAYLQSLEPVAGLSFKTEGNVENGYKYYQSSCGACHGGKAEGNESLNSPRLSGLSPVYLARQYQHFLSGARGSHKDDKFGRQMKMIAATLADEDKVKDVIAYIASL